MKGISRILATGLFLAALAPSAFAQTRFAGWHTDLKSAAALSAKTGKPMFVVFRCVR